MQAVSLVWCVCVCEMGGGGPVVEVRQGHGDNKEDEIAPPTIVQMGPHYVQVRHEHHRVDAVVCNSTQP